jgi:glycine/D-amino acid oxidase-like deaminating enzyme
VGVVGLETAADDTPAYTDLPNHSPWVAQLAPDGPPRPLLSDVTSDVVVVGAGIAGIATAFFLLRTTSGVVMLLERDRVGRGASGYNAGQLTTYFERPLSDIAEQYGWVPAAQAQRDVEEAQALLDEIVAEAGAAVRVERFTGRLGMFNRHQVEVHLRCELVRNRAGLPPHECLVSEEAPFLAELSAELAPLYSLSPQSRVQELLEVEDDRYCAVLSEPKGCSNSGLLCQQLLEHLERAYPDRFVYADHTHAGRVVVDSDRVALDAGSHRVEAGHVVLCTNGFDDHVVEDAAGAPIRLARDQRITGRTGHMVAFVDTRRPPATMSYIRNSIIGGETAYVYVTRRTYDRAGGPVMLTCMGGPEHPRNEPTYDRDALFPATLLEELDREVRPFAQAARAPGRPFEFHWHGLMGYNDSGIRVIGAHPHHPRLLYNLGCNGVGFLPSIHGGQRIARLLAGDDPGPSVFDPR